MSKLTQKQVIAALKQIGLTMRATGYGKEVRVNYKGGAEATAYYTDDLEDALGTGKHMAREREQAAIAKIVQDRKAAITAPDLGGEEPVEREQRNAVRLYGLDKDEVLA